MRKKARGGCDRLSRRPDMKMSKGGRRLFRVGEPFQGH